MNPASDVAVYREPGRSYVALLLILVLFALGCVLDVVLTGQLVHLAAWIGAAVVVAGINLIAIHTARALRSVVVTRDEVRVGSAGLPRSSIVGVDPAVEAGVPVLGQTVREGLPRGVPGLALRLADGGAIVVPTRHPQRLAAVLEVSAAVPFVRPAEPEDLPALAEIEERASALFRVAGTPLPSGWSSTAELDEPTAVFVVGRPPYGFIRLVEVDGTPNIAVIGLVPGRVREGIGSLLLEAACDWAREQGHDAITVTAYADVPWNAPFFAARGFAEITELGPGMVELRDWERAVGLDSVGRRVVMRREL